MEELLFKAMAEAMEKKQELELQLIIAQRECAALEAAYRAYVCANKEVNGNESN